MGAKRKKEQTSFDDVVAGLRRARPDPAQPETIPHGQLPPTDPSRVVYPIAVRAIRASEAKQLVTEGAALGWDGCGCVSPACLEWFDEGERAGLVRQGRLEAEPGALWLWTNADGDLAVLADVSVQWGHAMG